MKYSPHIYAKALVEVLGDRHVSDAEAAKNFLSIVRENGDEGRLRKILEEASRFARGKDGVRKVTISSARALTPAQRKATEHFVKHGDVVEYETDPALIAGMKITVNDEMQFDGSLKNKLNRALGNV
jgi:F0F1-type ATP synthase delta subunit